MLHINDLLSSQAIWTCLFLIEFINLNYLLLIFNIVLVLHLICFIAYFTMLRNIIKTCYVKQALKLFLSGWQKFVKANPSKKIFKFYTNTLLKGGVKSYIPFECHEYVIMKIFMLTKRGKTFIILFANFSSILHLFLQFIKS